MNSDDGDLIENMKQKPNLLVVFAKIKTQVVGYKIGYELDDYIFYSWLGGVDENYRNRGIASKLMEMQHEILREKGYRIVRTKTNGVIY